MYGLELSSKARSLKFLREPLMKLQHCLFVAAGAALIQLPSLADDGVVVKKNADGSVEATDAAPKPAAPNSAPPVQYHLKNTVGTRRIGGVLVRTNPDGSIETLDEGSAPHVAGPAARHRAVHRTSSTTTKKKQS
jgi:hypothetical protein